VPSHDDDLGGGVAEGDDGKRGTKDFAQTISKVASTGFMRGQLDRFVVVRGNTAHKVDAVAMHEHDHAHMHTHDDEENNDPEVSANFAEIGLLVQEAASNPVGEAVATLESRIAVDVRTKAVSKQDIYAKRAAQARLQGYEGDACGSCGNFTLVRNGTCMKCNTCGSTSGCS
jgi:ribonucleoside-diphosphate reductase alpha chain